ncbi:hypothetical protein Taro_000611 [Colocasia esculenta]|uniref:Uncharacterized protein n=1 Tax=Colocasia esculenta TaxID=4460 RepID=A0A843TH17_COLES|nr:hypothetical protein [Colocasia esculenta]
MAVSSQQAVAPRSPGVRPSGKKECPHCGRTHGGTECWKLGVQHGAPAPAAVAAAAPTTGRPGRPRAQARVFALAREDAEQAEHIIEGTVLFMGVHARVLFYMGGTHSFIFERFARQLAVESGLEAEELEVPLFVYTPAGTILYYYDVI